MFITLIDGLALRPLFSTVLSVFLYCELVLSGGCSREQTGPTKSISTEPITEPEQSKPGTQPVVSSEYAETSSPELVAEARPSLDVAAVSDAGLRALQAGETEEAYDLARQAMRLDADNPQVMFLMAMVLAERHRFPEAIEMLEEVARTTPEARLPAMGQSAEWLVQYGHWTEAESRYLEILQQVPDSVLVHRKMASLLMRQGRRIEALAHLDQLCRLGDVTEAELRSMLSVAHPLAADAEVKKLDPIGAHGMARSEIAQGDWQAARDRLEKIESPGPWDLALLGRTYAVLEDVDSLRKWISSSDESVDVSPDAWFAKGVYAVSAGQHADATRCFAETVLLDPTDWEAYAKMAQSLATSNSTAEAAAVEQRAELIERTQAIGNQMADTGATDGQSVSQLVDLLRQLGRPLEALGWRGVLIADADAASSDSEAQAQLVLDEIVRERTALLSENQGRASADFVLCGVNLDALPSRKEVNEHLRFNVSDKTE